MLMNGPLDTAYRCRERPPTVDRVILYRCCIEMGWSLNHNGVPRWWLGLGYFPAWEIGFEIETPAPELRQARVRRDAVDNLRIPQEHLQPFPAHAFRQRNKINRMGFTGKLREKKRNVGIQYDAGQCGGKTSPNMFSETLNSKRERSVLSQRECACSWSAVQRSRRMLT